MKKIEFYKENILYIVMNWIKWDKKGTVFAFSRIPLCIVIPAVTALIPKLMIEAIEKQLSLDKFIFTLLSFMVVVIILSWIDPATKEKTTSFQKRISMHYAVEAFEKLLDMDYNLLESYEGRFKYERCKRFANFGSNSDGAWAIVRLSGLCTSLFGLLTYLVIIIKVDIRLVSLILFTCFTEYLISKFINKIASQAEDGMSREELNFSYFYRISSEESIAKDIRLFGAKKWLRGKITYAANRYTAVLHWYAKESFKYNSARSICAMVRDIATFAFLIGCVFNKKIDVADFMFYFALVSGFSSWINDISGHIVSMQRISIECQKYRDFINLKKVQISPKYDTMEIVSVDEIEFKNVSFDYGINEPILKNINFTAKKGDRIAIVGENGAGKTTLIKIMCGLYQPTSGQVLVNGRDVSQLNPAEYYNLFSAIFQDYTLLPTTVILNITGSTKNINYERVNYAIKTAGLDGLVESLPQKISTKLVPQLNDDAVELSGGEQQKLLLARAIYKDAPVIVLDEPTSALDALAEEKLYKKYSEISDNKISFFVSHRLTSTKFCTKILMLKDGEILESGSHNELMDLNGEYRNMYSIQGIYYRKESESK